MLDISQTDAIERIGLSLLAGMALGLERDWHEKAAGVRTYALVCEGSTLFMIVSLLIGNEMRALGQTYDPSRIASTVVQGVGFLAGGLIFTQGARVKGLTTAAGIWVAAAVGLLVGAGFFLVAFVGVFATIGTLLLLHRFDTHLHALQARTGLSDAESEPVGSPRAETKN